jgi:hypothetical protein
MYAFRQRSDTTVFDEPLYGHYLAVTGLDHPGRAEILAAMDTDGSRVVAEVLLADCDRPVRFYKNMAHHVVGLDLAFLDRLSNVLLTRNPTEMLVSLTKELPDADIDETGLPQQVMLLDRMVAAGRTPVVLDATEVLGNPEAVLTALCAEVGIPFDPAMLAWPAGPKPEDGVWAPHWYGSVHHSTGFAPYRPKTEPFPDHLEPLLAACRPLYAQLAEHAIRAG